MSKPIQHDISCDTILEELYLLGVRSGDLLLITADLLNVGLTGKKDQIEKNWLYILASAVGPKGSVIVASFTSCFPRWKKDANIVFARNSPTTSGAIARLLVKQPFTFRSSHPTNSFVGFGDDARNILCKHTESSLSYDPIGEIIQRGGKHLVLGALDHKNAPMAFHFAQQKAGLTRSHPAAGFFQSYYLDEQGSRRLFTRWDIGGCSAGGKNLYGHFLADKVATIGKTGRAYSCLIDGASSLEIALKLFERAPHLLKCSDTNCISCYGRFTEYPIRSTLVYLNYIKTILRKQPAHAD
jgi:aminoglycoside 3-N-acetyltransferase